MINSHAPPRIFETTEHNFVVQYIPACLHGQTMVCIIDAIGQALRIPDPTGEYSYDRLFLRTGPIGTCMYPLYVHVWYSANHDLVVKINHPNKEFKQGDGGFQRRFEKYEEPSVVIELGIPETASDLRADMVWWFACGEVRHI